MSLGRILKTDFKNTWKYFAVLNGAVFIPIFILKISTEDCMTPALNFFIFPGITLIPKYTLIELRESLSSDVLIQLLTFIISYILISVYFYRDLYADRASHASTMPASSANWLWSKIIIGVFWTSLTFLVRILSFRLGAKAQDVSDLFGMFTTAFTYSPEYALLGGTLIVYLVASLTARVFSYYACVSVGQLFAKHRLLAAILICCGWSLFYFIAQLVSLYAFILIAMSSKVYIPEWGAAILWTLILLDFAICIASFLISSRVLKKKSSIYSK